MEENKLVIQSELAIKDIKNLIYTIRETQVMLDSDVAMLYDYETKKINQTVKSNIENLDVKNLIKNILFLKLLKQINFTIDLLY